MRALHQRKHPGLDVPGCFGCRVSSVNMAPSAMPSRNEGARAGEIETTEKRWHKDMAAYKRLVHNGQQPPRIDGCAQLEASATEPEHITMGRTTARIGAGREVLMKREHFDTASDILGGHKVTEPHTSPIKVG